MTNANKINKLSIVIPAFNEQDTIAQILQKVLAVKFPCQSEIIIVNDSSQDQTSQIIRKLAKKYAQLKVFEHRQNMGKGAAVKTGIQNVTGDYIVIQDADLEYNPEDLVRMVSALKKSNCQVIYGSRLTEPPVLFGPNRTPLILHYFGNKFLSLVTSLLYGSWLTDMETCYKLFPKKAMSKINLNARGFELEPEITAKLLKNGFKIAEIAITTKPRGYEEGKKLNTWRDGEKAFLTLIKYRFTD